MKHKIKNLLLDYRKGELTFDEATDALLLLCNSSLQFNASLKIGDEVIYCGEKYIINFIDLKNQIVNISGEKETDWYNHLPLNYVTKSV